MRKVTTIVTVSLLTALMMVETVRADDAVAAKDFNEAVATEMKTGQILPASFDIDGDGFLLYPLVIKKNADGTKAISGSLKHTYRKLGDTEVTFEMTLNKEGKKIDGNIEIHPGKNPDGIPGLVQLIVSGDAGKQLTVQGEGWSGLGKWKNGVSKILNAIQATLTTT